MNWFRIFFLLLVLTFGGIYALTRGGKTPITLPGDLLIIKANRRIYIPFGSTLLITIILFLILRSLFA
ncbi:hypothetical protein A2685_00450 [Candidatus Woesebacteria bacterium RIFCSPHIGHO2_01_FULL_37_10]|uniref:DUF2905 domain-containing protein n=1 Tax=Candidatus Woesebacteria bacterium RIFCSPHIGHO2_01_FULL_37_10 TaxID=1802489 RepID=A0A1F7XUP3_9BACT|nr:MAG: hypothetical protein A2685_00450 [Candidatus Woesebacteria bacterium RIFCSPHIGHO2_01_FULL_37_10]